MVDDCCCCFLSVRVHPEMFRSEVSEQSVVVLEREAQYDNKAYSLLDLIISEGLLFQRFILSTHSFLLAPRCDVKMPCAT